MGNSFAGGKNEFKWRIDGFSSLLSLEAKQHFSNEFEACGYKWKLLMHPNALGSNGNRCLSLFLCLKDPSSVESGMAIKTTFKLLVYDQFFCKHHMGKVTFYFQNTVSMWGFPNLMLLKTFQSPTSGYLVNDCCFFGVEVIEAQTYKLKCQDMSQWLSLKKEKVSGTYTWKIDDFSKLQGPCVSSKAFLVGGLKWHINLYPKGYNTDDHLSVYLVLEDITKHGTYVECSLCMKNQINTDHVKLTYLHSFDSKTPSYGFPKLISLKDYRNSSKGFLVENVCVIEASLTVLGTTFLP